MQQIVASGLAAQTCQFDRPCTNLAWCSFPGESLSQRIHLNSPPTRIYKTAAKEVMTKIPGQHTWLAIKPQLNPCKGKHEKIGAAAAIHITAAKGDRSGDRSEIHSIIMTGKQLQRPPPPPPFIPPLLRYVSQRPNQSQRLRELFPPKPYYLL